MKFRKKPVVVEAVQFTGDVNEIREFMGDKKGIHGINPSGRYIIETLEGTMYASKGDWIIKGVKGEYYPCKPDIFTETYEPLEEE